MKKRDHTLDRSSEELKPCPFCGNTNILVYEEEGKFGFTEWIVECDSHYCACQPTAHDSYQTKEEAIEAWNTRAERTCRYKHIEGTWYMSECGERYDYIVPPNYCPNCGAKVVEE